MLGTVIRTRSSQIIRIDAIPFGYDYLQGGWTLSARPSAHPIEGETSALPVFVRLLGAPSVTLGDQTLKFRYRKAEALLYMLVVERRSVARTRIAQLLWPGADAKSSTRNLSVVLNDVRAKIGERLVAPSDSPYVSLQRVRTDLERIESLASLPLDALASGTLLTQSASLLDGFHLDDSSDFEEWLRHADDQVQERLSSARAKRIEQALSVDAADVAFALVDASVQRDPWNETLLLRLIRLALRRGDVTLALRRLRSSIEAIRTELEIEPSPDLLALVGALTPTRQSGSSNLTRLVGHVTAQETLEAWATHGAEDVLALVGAPGVGTTTLARSVLLANPLLHEMNVQVVDLHDVEAEDVERRLRAIVDAVDGSSGVPIVLLDGLGDSQAVRKAVRTVIERTVGVRWIYTAYEPLGVNGERVLDVDPLRVPPAAMLRLQPGVPSIDLFLRAVSAYAPGRTFELPEEATLTRLLRRTGGNPLAIAALAVAVAGTQDASKLDLHEVLSAEIPEVRLLRDRLEPLLNMLPEDVRRTAAVLALFESGARPAELSYCVDQSETQVGDALRQLQRQGWIVEDVTAQRVYFRVVPWASFVLQAEAHQLRDASNIQARFAACIRDRVISLAEELQGARQREAVEEGLVMLGDVITATDVFAIDEPTAALGLAAAAWPLFRRAGREDELLARIEPLTRAHIDELDGTARADALATLANLMILVGRIGESRPLHEEALVLRDAMNDSRSRAQSRLNFAQVLAMLGELEAASDMLEEGALIARSAEEMWHYAGCLGNLGHVLHKLERLEQAVSVYDEALVVLESLGDTLSSVGIRVAQLNVLAHLGLRDRVVRCIHLLELRMQSVPFGTARSLDRPMRVAIDELAHAGWLHAAERLERSAYDHGFIVD